MELSAAVRRLRMYLNDKPVGFSKSGINASTDISAAPGAQFKIAFGVSAPVSLTVNPAGLNTGGLIASAIQAVLRAAHPTNPNFSNARVVYDAAGFYTITAGSIGTGSLVTITAGDVFDVTSALKLGISNGGLETYTTDPRYTDEDLADFINFGLEQYNNSVPASYQMDLATADDKLILIALYYAWILALETSVGQFAYTYRQTVGADTTDLSQVFRNLMELLRYLREQIGNMKDDVGIGNILIGELIRSDRLSGMKVPAYDPISRMPRPRILALSKVTVTQAMIQWQEIQCEDFIDVTVYTSLQTGIVDLAQLNETQNNNGMGIAAHATSQRRITHPLHTVLNLPNLATGVVYFVVVFRDNRGTTYYSDEYSLDLSQSNPLPVLTVNNAPKG